MCTKLSYVLLLAAAVAGSACNKPDSGQLASNNFLPPPGFRGDADQGAGVYDRFCAACHGAGGLGSDKGPPLIHKIYESNHHGDISFFYAARNGVAAHHWQFGNMPPIAGITPQEVAHIVAYVRREQRAAGIN